MSEYIVTLTAHTTDGIRSVSSGLLPLGEALDTAAGMTAVGEENVIEIKIERTPRHEVSV